jgi:membrane-associated phospholipid phosphatase
MTMVQAARESLRRPYRVPVSMIVMMLVVPGYILIPASITTSTLHAPATALDRAIPLQPPWALVYGALYLSLILLPIFIVRDFEHLRRTMYAYLFVWLTAYVCFVFYPTVAPRPPKEIVPGSGFAVWALQSLYDSDPPFNCFPSIHVGHSFVSALTCLRIHRRLSIAALAAAAVVAVSTLFTKQHYALDAVAGIGLAVAAYLIFLRNQPREVDALDRRAAPALALATLGAGLAGVAGFFVVYQLQGAP